VGLAGSVAALATGFGAGGSGRSVALASRCLPSSHRPRLVAAALPADLLAILGVLRRAPSTDDRRYCPMGDGVVAEVAVNYVRYLGLGADGRRYYLVPEILRLPLAARHRRSSRTTSSPRRSFGLAVLSDGGGGGAADAQDVVNGYTAESVELDLPASPRALATHPRSGVTGLVPDGVVRVVALYPRGLTRQAQVTNNFYAYDVPLQAPQALPPELDWINRRNCSGRRAGACGVSRIR